MIYINNLIRTLREKNIALSTDGDVLKISTPQEPLNPEIVELIKSNKGQIIEILRQEDKHVDLVAINRSDNSSYALLSAQQKSLWVLHQANSENFSAYNESMLFELNGKLSLDAINTTIKQMIDRHEILRTIFIQNEQGVPLVKILNNVTFNAHVENIGDELLDNYINQEISNSFNLSCWPLFRLRILFLDNNRYLLLFVFHHILIDGVSLGIFCKEFSNIYNCILNNTEHDFLPSTVQYLDYSSWQSMLFDTVKYQDKLSSYINNFKGYQELNFAVNKPRKNSFSYKGKKYQFSFDKVLSEKLLSLAKQEKTTLFNIMLAGFSIVLSKYLRQEDILIGAAMANRTNIKLNKVLGFFANTVVLRNHVNSELVFKDFLDNVRNVVLDAYDHQEISFEHVISKLKVDRDPSRNPFVQAMLTVVNKTSHPQLSLHGVNSKLLESFCHNSAKFDLTLMVFEENKFLSGYFEYAIDLFNEEDIRLLFDNLQQLFAAVSSDPKLIIKNIPLGNDKDNRMMLIDWNSHYKNYSISKTLHDRFKQQAIKTPHVLAVKYGDSFLTYQELDEQSNQIARYIQKKYQSLYSTPLPQDTIIGICLDRSIDTIVSILAVLKVGAAYLPIDPTSPEERIEYIISDSKAALLLTESKIVKNISGLQSISKNLLITLDDNNIRNEIYNESNAILEIEVKFTNLAYVIYTSGSTGKPKGVLLPHINVLKLFSAATEYYQFGEKDVWTLFHSYAFDFSVWEIWGALLFGGKLIVVPYETSKDPEAFYYLSKNEGVTVLNQTPSAFRNFIDVDLNATNKIDTLRYVIFGGEALNIEILRDWWKSHDDKSPLLVNMYGITETTVHVTYQELSISDLEKNRHGRIGVPLNNLRVYVLDENNRLSPIGVPGELYIGGDGLACGYLNKPELTSEKFIKNPFALTANLPIDDRLYKTGDLVRWLSDGSLEYIGRTDFQVKLRGFRIELGEIEEVLNKHHSIKQVIVILRNDEDKKYLAAYYTMKEEANSCENDEFISYLRQFLPEYMIPTAWVKLKSIPLTGNGKIDKTSLPKPSMQEMGGVYVPPTTDVELTITKIWSELLNIEETKISVTDNYFQLGGNSLSIFKMIIKVKEKSEIDLPVSSFLRSPTIRDISKLIVGCRENIEGHILKVKKLILSDKYLPENIEPLAVNNTQLLHPKKILITGATGFLGSYLVNELCKLADIEIYCLVREVSAEKAKIKLNNAFIKNQLQHLVNKCNINVVCGDFEQGSLGINPADYSWLAHNIDVIYHNGALVHHLYDYERMRASNVISTHELLKLAITYRNKAFHFISTIGIANFNLQCRLEKEDLNWSFLESNGYLLTKWVSEQLVIEAARRGIDAHVFRPGNITGHSRTGFCVPEYNHTLLKIKGFIQLGQAYYDDSETLEMMPVDILARSIVKSSFDRHSEVVLNMNNSKKIKFSEYVSKFIENNYQIEKIDSINEWNNILNQVKEDNGLYFLKAFYEKSKNENSDSMIIPSKAEYQDCDYDVLISSQVNFLQGVKFIPEARC